jgi:Kef-type K+ transport system membrane component KefB
VPVPVGARRLITYVVLVVVPLAGLAAILRAGADGATTMLARPAIQGPAPASVALLLVQAIAIVVAARVAGALLDRVGQPRVVGEMLAGVALGPSLLGWLAPAVSTWLFPAASLGSLGTLSQLGLLVFIFLVGLELDTAALRTNGRAALIISHASITVPFLLGAALAVWLYPRYAEGHAPFRAFALYLGAAMSVTAFPVLARILSERGLVRTRIGSMAIACAAVDDVTAWLLLALVVVIARADAGLGGVAVTAMSTLAYAGAVLWLGRPALRRLLRPLMDGDRITRGGLSVVVLVLLASAATTEMLGVHALFGAFLAGAAMPRDARLREALRSRLEDLVLVLLLPIFFALTGLRTDFRLIGGRHDLAALGLVLAAAVGGKLGGSTLAGWAVGMPLHEAAALGALLNTRGLMELVILSIGLELGIITSAVFAMMVVMTLITTLATTPLVSWLLRPAAAPVTPPRATVREP